MRALVDCSRSNRQKLQRRESHEPLPACSIGLAGDNAGLLSIVCPASQGGTAVRTGRSEEAAVARAFTPFLIDAGESQTRQLNDPAFAHWATQKSG